MQIAKDRDLKVFGPPFKYVDHQIGGLHKHLKPAKTGSR